MADFYPPFLQKIDFFGGGFFGHFWGVPRGSKRGHFFGFFWGSPGGGGMGGGGMGGWGVGGPPKRPKMPYFSGPRAAEIFILGQPH